MKQIHLVSEARAVFVASNVDGTFSKEEVVIKIRMQYIPYSYFLVLSSNTGWRIPWRFTAGKTTYDPSKAGYRNNRHSNSEWTHGFGTPNWGMLKYTYTLFLASGQARRWWVLGTRWLHNVYPHGETSWDWSEGFLQRAGQKQTGRFPSCVQRGVVVSSFLFNFPSLI